MALGNLASAGKRTLYVSGEESAAGAAAGRAAGERALAVPVLAETGLAEVVATIEAERPQVCIVDSVQTLHAEGCVGRTGLGSAGAPGGGELMEIAKRLDVAVIVVGHVTKEGSLAGPRALEHLVDCVLMFEGERERSCRTLRALKNRFGATSEVAVFEMRSGGLTEVTDPSARFVGEAAAVPGSCVLCAMEGRAAAGRGPGAGRADRDRPTAADRHGIDRNRLSLVLAVLARHARSRSRAPTCSSTSRECGSRSRARTSRSRWRSPSAHRGEALAGTSPVHASVRSASPGSCATWPIPSAASRRRSSSGSAR